MIQHELVDVIEKGTDGFKSSYTNCSVFKAENRQLRNQVKSLQSKLNDKRKILRKMKGQGEDKVEIIYFFGNFFLSPFYSCLSFL